MVISKNTRTFSRFLFVASIAAWTFSAQPASAFLGRAFGGAMKGAFLGSLLDGREGAQTGAAIGAGVGLLSAVAEDAERRDAKKGAQARYEQQKAQMELRRQQEEQERFEIESRSPGDGVPSNVAAIGTLQPHEDADLISEIQRNLVKMGYETGAIDGRMSETTMAAIQAYQAKNNLLETGQPSRELLQHMVRKGD